MGVEYRVSFQHRDPETRRHSFISYCIKLYLCVSVSLCSIPVRAQDASESLGPKDAPGSATWRKEPHPLTRLMAERNSTLRAELRGKHPRVYVTDEEIEALRTRARTTHKEIWRPALANVRPLKQEPPPAPAQPRRAQNEVGIGIA